jgi:hypothetical protein
MTTRGISHPLYILPFDHRGAFQKSEGAKNEQLHTTT